MMKVVMSPQNKTRAQQEHLMKLLADFSKQEERVLTIAGDLEEQINTKTEKVMQCLKCGAPLELEIIAGHRLT